MGVERIMSVYNELESIFNNLGNNGLPPELQELQERASQFQQQTEPIRQTAVQQAGGIGNMSILTIVLIVIGVIILILIFTNIQIVPQAHEYILEVLGKYKATWKAGIHVKVPIFSRIANRVTVKEQVLDTPPQPVITKDNVTMQIDAIVYYHIYDSKLYTYGAADPVFALANLSATTLRNIIGGMTLDEALTSRDVINARLTELLDVATDPWGIKVTRVELKNILPPDEIRHAMEKEMKAERDRRQTILEAEGHKQAVITRAEGDKQALVLAAEGDRDARIARAEGEAQALRLAKEAEAAGIRCLKEAGADDAVIELKRFETLQRLANGQAAKIIIPTDVVQSVKKNVVFSETAGLGSVTEEGEEPIVDVAADPCCEGKVIHKPGDADRV